MIPNDFTKNQELIILEKIETVLDGSNEITRENVESFLKTIYRLLDTKLKAILMVGLLFVSLLLTSCAPSGMTFLDSGKGVFISLKDSAITLAIAQGLSEPSEIVTHVNTKLLTPPTYPKVTVQDVIGVLNQPIKVPDFDCDHTLGTIADAAILFALSQDIRSSSAIELYMSNRYNISVKIPHTKRMQWEFAIAPRTFNSFLPRACQYNHEKASLITESDS